MLRVETNYANGVPQTAVSGFAPTGVAMHWTAGGTGRSGALWTVQHFINTRTTINASYHILVWWDAAAQVTGAMWIVPPTRAAHSLAPASAFKHNANIARATQDAWFAEVRRILGVKAADPNAGCIAVSFCGMPADLANAMKSPVFIADMKQLVADLKTIRTMNAKPLFNHGWIQPISRYDAGEALIPALYSSGPTPVPVDDVDMQFWKPVTEQWTTKSGGKFWDGNGAQKAFNAGARVTSIAESNDGKYRLVRLGTNELLVAERAGLNPVSGTRIPASGFGFPPPEVREVVKEVVKDASAGQLQAAVDAEKARIRKVLGV